MGVLDKFRHKWQWLCYTIRHTVPLPPPPITDRHCQELDETDFIKETGVSLISLHLQQFTMQDIASAFCGGLFWSPV